MKPYYTVSGSVRGNISINHRSLDAAIRVLRRDHNACHSLGGGAYSDCSIYRHDADGTDLMIEVDDEWMTMTEANERMAAEYSC